MRKRDVFNFIFERVEAARKRVKRFIDDSIGIYQIVYCCIKGGVNFKTTSTGERSSSTFQTNCPASIKFTASKDGHALQVMSITCDHNHDISEELYRRYPQQRRLPEETQEKVKKLLKLKANRKLVKEQIQAESGKVILMRDLSNIAASDKPGERNSLVATVEKLQTKYGADCHVFADADKDFKGLLFCTQDMKDTMAAFPEFLGIDATYKLLDMRAPVYLIHNEDSNGMTEIVAVCILVSEDHESVSWFLEKFIELNPSASRTKCIMADKDLQERAILKQCFPQANVLICAYHTLRTFNREISCNKLQITPGVRLASLALLQKMVHAPNEEKYNAYYEELRNGNGNVLRYFDANWHPIRDEWSKCAKFNESNFLNCTNNRLESINGKLKSVITPHSSLEDFVDGFFSIYKTMCDERDQKAANSHSKQPIMHFPSNGPEQLYSQFCKQVKLPDTSCDGVYEIGTSHGPVTTSTTTCTCHDSSSMLLPCRDVFAVRQYSSIDLFCEELCAERWTKVYYQANQRLFTHIPVASVELPRSTLVATPGRRTAILSQHQKFRKASNLLKDIVGLISEESGKCFESRLQVMLEIKRAWENNEEVKVVNKSATETQYNIAEMEVIFDCNVQDEMLQQGEEEVLNLGPNAALTETSMESTDNLRYETMQQQQSTESTENVQNEMLPQGEPAESTCPNAASTEILTEIALNTIKMPTSIRKRGRPKGSDKTVIGIPKKRTKIITKAVPFKDMQIEDQKNAMLKWFVDGAVAHSALSKLKLIEEQDVQTRPELIPHASLDENVDISLIRPLFSADAWVLIENVMHIKATTVNWECTSCYNSLESESSIVCDCCLMWYHITCVGLLKVPKKKSWICQHCVSRYR